jgi:hypothetical protein
VRRANSPSFIYGAVRNGAHGQRRNRRSSHSHENERLPSFLHTTPARRRDKPEKSSPTWRALFFSRPLTRQRARPYAAFSFIPLSSSPPERPVLSSPFFSGVLSLPVVLSTTSSREENCELLVLARRPRECDFDLKDGLLAGNSSMFVRHPFSFFLLPV